MILTTSQLLDLLGFDVSEITQTHIYILIYCDYVYHLGGYCTGGRRKGDMHLYMNNHLQQLLWTFLSSRRA
jgi:hypothetical protein